jgi:CheY-like chemotaxis protein
MNISENSKLRYKVMLIDDTEVDAFISKRMLTSTQFSSEITEFYSAQKALEFLDENRDNSFALPHLIFLDLHMPAMDGFDFMEKFEMLPKSVVDSCKVIMLSSSIDPLDEKKIKQNKNILKFLTKPLSKDQLMALEVELNETINK